jgi:hypothetical protein
VVRLVSRGDKDCLLPPCPLTLPSLLQQEWTPPKTWKGERALVGEIKDDGEMESTCKFPEPLFIELLLIEVERGCHPCQPQNTPPASAFPHTPFPAGDRMTIQTLQKEKAGESLKKGLWGGFRASSSRCPGGRGH